MYQNIEGLNPQFELALQRAIDSIRFHCRENRALPIFSIAVRDGGEAPLYITCDVISQDMLVKILGESLMDAQMGAMMENGSEHNE